MRTLIVIPARLESTRLPRKLLLAETGKPLIMHTYEQASLAKCSEDNPQIAGDEAFVRAAMRYVPVFGSTAAHPNGTSRVADWVQDQEYDAYCIVQADEPEIDPALIDLVVSELEKHEDWDCATAAIPTMSEADFKSRDRVKVMHGNGLAVHFTRDYAGGVLHSPDVKVEKYAALHIGIYAYRRDALLRYAAAGPCEREQAESLEQLRALHIGLKMGVVLWEGEHHGGIDTREDYDAFVKRQEVCHSC